MAVSSRLIRIAPLLTAAAALVLYQGTAARVHLHDAPVYARQVTAGDWLHGHHLLPRVLAALTWEGARAFDPELNPYAAFVLLCSIAGALSVGLVHAVARELVRSELLAVSAAALFAVSRGPWRIATTFELGLMPLVPLLLALWIACRADRDVGPARAAAIGALQGMAMALHLVSTGALAVWLVWIALAPRPARERLQDVAVMVGAAAVSLATAFAVAVLAWPPGAGVRPLLASVFGPTLDDARGLPRPVGDLWFGLRSAFVGVAGGPVADLVLGAALLTLIVATPALWRRAGVIALLPPAWIAGACVVALRVEPGNYEYFTGAAAALVLWAALATDRLAPRLAPASAPLVLLVALSSWPIVASTRSSPTGTHVGLVRAGSDGHEYQDAWGRPVPGAPADPKPPGPRAERRPPPLAGR